MKSTVTDLKQWRAQRVQSDPNLSLKALYSEHQDYVRRTLFWMVPPDVVDDLVQEVFLKVWKNIIRFRGDSGVKTWIYRITMNTAFDYLRKSKRSAVPLEEVSGQVESGESRVVMQQLIRRGVEDMPPRHRSVFIMYYKQGLTIEEIAKILNIPEGTVKSRLHNAREIFRKYIEKNGVSYVRK